MSTQDKNKLIVDVAIGHLNNGDWDLMSKLYSQKFVQHPPAGREKINWDKFELACRNTHATLPTLQYNIEDIIAEGDKVVVRMSSSATIKPKKPQRYFVPRKFQMTEINIFRIERGRIVEEWCEFDVEKTRQLLQWLRYAY